MNHSENFVDEISRTTPLAWHVLGDSDQKEKAKVKIGTRRGEGGRRTGTLRETKLIRAAAVNS